MEWQDRDRRLVGQRQPLGRQDGLRLWRGLRLGGAADFKRIDPDRFGNVLELGRTEIGDSEVEPCLHLPIGVLGKTDGAGLGDAFQTRRDVDAIAHQIAIALLDDVPEMNADAELDAALGRQAGVAFDEAVLHLNGAAYRDRYPPLNGSSECTCAAYCSRIL